MRNYEKLEVFSPVRRRDDAREVMNKWRETRAAAALALSILLSVPAAGLAAAGEPDVYERENTTFDVNGKKVKGYEVRARVRYPFSMVRVLDASHDHLHLSELDRDIQREEVSQAHCTKQICTITVDVLVGSFFPVGEVTYELDTTIRENDDGTMHIEWTKVSGTRFVKHLHGMLLLTPHGEEDTAVDYHIEVAAPRLSADKLGDKAEAFLDRLGTILEERHEGHPSLWKEIKETG